MNLSDDTRAELGELLATIRVSLSRIDHILHLEAQPAAASDVAATLDRPAEFEIVDHQPMGKFTYRWPGGTIKYLDAIKYTVRHGDAEDVFAIGAEEGGRASYQQNDRGRIVVFHRRGATDMSYYPLVEFAESDLDRELYAAIVPQPDAPRKGTTAADLEELRRVAHLKNAKLERADVVFHSVQNGPTLRVLVGRNDPKMMIEHAWWVGSLRGTSW